MENLRKNGSGSDSRPDALLCEGAADVSVTRAVACARVGAKEPEATGGKRRAQREKSGDEPGVMIIRRYGSPCGELTLGSLDGKLALCDWGSEQNHERVVRRLQRLLQVRFQEGSSPVIEQAARQLDEYFAGKRRTFDIPLLFAGTQLQRAVWNELRTIPFAQTISYAALSMRLGIPKAVRAVANANGANALSIFVPCHRVIGSDGSPTGYGGGLAAKRFLLELESAARPKS